MSPRQPRKILLSTSDKIYLQNLINFNLPNEVRLEAEKGASEGWPNLERVVGRPVG